MMKNLSSVIRQLPICKRCGGQVLRYYDEFNCLQCGAPHTEEYKLAIRSVEEVPGSQLQLKRRYNERKRSCYY